VRSRLLRGQVVERVGRAPAGVLAGRLELDPRTLRERVNPEVREAVVRDPQLLAGVRAPPLAAESRAVEEVGAGEVERHPASPQAVDRVPVEVLGARPSARSAPERAASPSAHSVPLTRAMSSRRP
jgi:hypothetical protein